jgi:hypothetical protein
MVTTLIILKPKLFVKLNITNPRNKSQVTASKDNESDMMTHACNSNYLGDGNRKITVQGQPSKKKETLSKQ